MATTYDELKAEIQSESDNNLPNFVAAIPSFIHRAERRFTRLLRTLEMECRATHAAVPVGTTDENKGVYALPADWHQHKVVEVDNDVIKLLYMQSIPALSASNQTNWLLDKSDDLYVYGSLVFAEPWLKNDERIQIWSSLADSIIAEIVEEDEAGRYGGGPLQVRVGTQQLFRGLQQGQGRYQFLSPHNFFDLESTGRDIRQFGFRPGVFTIAERKLRILPKPGTDESGTAGWTGCGAVAPVTCCTCTGIPNNARSCLEDAPVLAVQIRANLQVSTISSANWAVRVLGGADVGVNAASVEQKISQPNYADGWYVLLTLDSGPTTTFYEVDFTESDLLAADGSNICSLSGVVEVAGCA